MERRVGGTACLILDPDLRAQLQALGRHGWLSRSAGMVAGRLGSALVAVSPAQQLWNNSALTVTHFSINSGRHATRLATGASHCHCFTTLTLRHCSTLSARAVRACYGDV